MGLYILFARIIWQIVFICLIQTRYTHFLGLFSAKANCNVYTGLFIVGSITPKLRPVSSLGVSPRSQFRGSTVFQFFVSIFVILATAEITNVETLHQRKG